MRALALAFGVTLVIEVPVVVALLRWRRPEVSTKSAVSAALLANVATHPVGIGLLLPLLTRWWGVLPALVVVEALVVVVEAEIYGRLFDDEVLGAAVSGVANVASFGIGAVLLR